MEREVIRRYKNPQRRMGFDEFSARCVPDEKSILVSASADNPFCGDSLNIALLVQNSPQKKRGIIRASCHSGYGCSLSIASMEILLEMIEGKRVEACLTLKAVDLIEALGGGEVGRTRMKCVELSLVAMKRALDTLQ